MAAIERFTHDHEQNDMRRKLSAQAAISTLIETEKGLSKTKSRARVPNSRGEVVNQSSFLGECGLSRIVARR